MLVLSPFLTVQRAVCIAVRVGKRAFSCVREKQVAADPALSDRLNGFINLILSHHSPPFRFARLKCGVRS